MWNRLSGVIKQGHKIARKCKTISGALIIGKHGRASEVLRRSTRRSCGKPNGQASKAMDKNTCTTCTRRIITRTTCCVLLLWSFIDTCTVVVLGLGTRPTCHPKSSQNPSQNWGWGWGGTRPAQSKAHRVLHGGESNAPMPRGTALQPQNMANNMDTV